jgi:tRNA pseudouridine38-40 synthase
VRVAARLAYWGPAYHGYARQPNVETVEGDLIRALMHVRAIRDSGTARLVIASRTDRGVSAVGNVVAFDSSLHPLKLPEAASGRMHHAWLLSSVRAEETFNPRHARRRTYRYHFPRDVPAQRLREAARVFEGDHDFTNFTVDRVAARLTIDRIRIRRDSSFVLVDFEAERFARGLVRRVAGAMEAYARGEVAVSDLRGALAGDPVQAPPASPEGLFLLDVDCGIPWRPSPERIVAAVRDHLRGAAIAHRFAESLTRQVDQGGENHGRA